MELLVKPEILTSYIYVWTYVWQRGKPFLSICCTMFQQWINAESHPVAQLCVNTLPATKVGRSLFLLLFSLFLLLFIVLVLCYLSWGFSVRFSSVVRQIHKDGAQPALPNFPFSVFFPFSVLCVLFVCKCIMYCCHRVLTKLRLSIYIYIIYTKHDPGFECR
jgi:hypothetical protein